LARQNQQRTRRLLYRAVILTKTELDNIDGFVDLTRKARKTQEKRLKRLAAQRGVTDDWLADDFAGLDDFATLSADFAVIGLWRCVELYRGEAIRIERAFARAARIPPSGIPKRIRCARTVDELRCLNNAIKHSRRVDGELAKFPRWRGKRRRPLGNLEGHYARLRSAAERYLSDLAGRLSRQITT
jgi:hypothetical protein